MPYNQIITTYQFVESFKWVNRREKGLETLTAGKIIMTTNFKEYSWQCTNECWVELLRSEIAHADTHTHRGSMLKQLKNVHFQVKGSPMLRISRYHDLVHRFIGQMHKYGIFFYFKPQIMQSADNLHILMKITTFVLKIIEYIQIWLHLL